MKIFLLVLIGFVFEAQAQTNIALTNALVTIPGVPIADRFTQVLDRALAALAAISVLANVLLTWWGANRAKLAALVAPLIKEIEKHNDPELKANIKDAAGELGIEPDLNQAVKDNTTGPIDGIKHVVDIPTPTGGVT